MMLKQMVKMVKTFPLEEEVAQEDQDIEVELLVVLEETFHLPHRLHHRRHHHRHRRHHLRLRHLHLHHLRHHGEGGEEGEDQICKDLATLGYFKDKEMNDADQRFADLRRTIL